LPVVGDRTQLQQVFLNLILNGMDAMEATPEDSRLLSVRTMRGARGIEVAVADCGSGIAPADEERLFEPFFTTRKEGVGLGLSISQSIVATHRGRIWAESNPGGGTTFHVSIPLAEHETSSQPADGR